MYDGRLGTRATRLRKSRVAGLLALTTVPLALLIGQAATREPRNQAAQAPAVLVVAGGNKNPTVIDTNTDTVTQTIVPTWRLEGCDEPHGIAHNPGTDRTLTITASCTSHVATCSW
jgi:hypothetical protein